MIVSAIYLISVDSILLLLRVLLMSQEVDVVSVLFRDGLYLWVPSAKNMLPPLFIVESCEFNPAFKVLILSLDDTLLPLLVCAYVIILIETVMPMVFCLLYSVKRDLLDCRFEYLLGLGIF